MSLGKRMLALISSIPGAADPQMEVMSGVAELQMDLIRPAMARYGLNVSDVQELVETTIGGQPVSEMIDGRARFPISVRLPDSVRNDPDALEELIAPRSGRRTRQVGSSGSDPHGSRSGSDLPRERTAPRRRSNQCAWN